MSRDGIRNLHHYESPEENHRHISRVGSLRPITQRQDETGKEGEKVHPFEDNTKDISDRAKEVRSSKGSCQDMENQEEVADGEPRKDHANSRVREFQQEHEFPQEAVVTPE